MYLACGGCSNEASVVHASDDRRNRPGLFIVLGECPESMLLGLLVVDPLAACVHSRSGPHPVVASQIVVRYREAALMRAPELHLIFNSVCLRNAVVRVVPTLFQASRVEIDSWLATGACELR